MNKLCSVDNEVPEDHMIYLVQRFDRARRIVRYDKMADAAKNVTDHEDYCVIVPNEHCYSTDELIAFVNNADEDNIIPIGKILEKANA